MFGNGEKLTSFYTIKVAQTEEMSSKVSEMNLRNYFSSIGGPF